MAFEAHPVTKERWPDLVQRFERAIVRTIPEAKEPVDGGR
jgi:hypothetical protein